jgi:hypothetical protein
MYLGNPSAFRLSHFFSAKGFMDAVGSRHFCSAMPQDNSSRSVASQFLYGSPTMFPISDIVHTDFLLVFGANPIVSHGGLISMAPISDHLAPSPAMAVASSSSAPHARTPREPSSISPSGRPPTCGCWQRCST